MIEDWLTSSAADGFNIMPPILPSLLDTFVEQVIPILQRRGLFRTEYRDHLASARAHPSPDTPAARVITLDFSS